MRLLVPALLLVASTAAGQTTQTTPPATTASTPPASAPVGRVFAAEAGLMFSAIRPERAGDFEMVLSRLRQALTTSTDPIRKQQASSWKVYKASEPGPNGSVLYVFVVDPVVKGADYGVAKILSEAFPSEMQDLYKLYNGAFAGGQTMLNLAPPPEPKMAPIPPAAATVPPVQAPAPPAAR